jgi:putative endonuclease
MVKTAWLSGLKTKLGLVATRLPGVAPATAIAIASANKTANNKDRGDAAENQALAHLQAQGLRLVQRNYRVARGPNARGGEIDLVMADPAGTLVFIEVRARRSSSQGGAAASVGRNKQRALVWAAQHYLQRYASPPPCRFDVVAIDGDHGEQLQWLQGAFDASP